MPISLWLRGITAIAALIVAFSVAAESREGNGAVTVVAKLYRDFAWEAVVEEPDAVEQGLLDQPGHRLAKYFDDSLVSLILKDRACAKKTKEVCRLNFSPIWASQDPGAAQLKVLATKAPNIVSVKFIYPSTGETIHLSYNLANTKHGWRITDVSAYSGMSLRSILSPKP